MRSPSSKGTSVWEGDGRADGKATQACYLRHFSKAWPLAARDTGWREPCRRDWMSLRRCRGLWLDDPRAAGLLALSLSRCPDRLRREGACVLTHARPPSGVIQGARRDGGGKRRRRCEWPDAGCRLHNMTSLLHTYRRPLLRDDCGQTHSFPLAQRRCRLAVVTHRSLGIVRFCIHPDITLPPS